MFDYQQLEALIDIEREGSFENTAYLKRISKSAISQKCKQIDQRAGIATIDRNPSCPTIFGKSLCRHVERIKLLESSLALQYGHIFDTAPFDRAAIRLAIDDELPSRCLLEHLEPRIQRESRFSFETIIARKVPALERLAALDVAAAISSQSTASKHFISHALGEFAFIATTSPDYARQAFPKGICERSIQKARCASYDRQNGLNVLFAQQRFGIDPGQPHFKISSHYGILNLCVDGFAWAMLPIHLVREHLQDGRLVNLCPGHVLKVPLFWNVSSCLDELISDTTKAIRETAHHLTSEPEVCETGTPLEDLTQLSI